MSEAMIPSLSDSGIPMGFAYKPGHRMPNGAIIISETVIVSPDEPERDPENVMRISVVLALTLSDVTPYCTWSRVVRSTYGSAVPKAQDFCETGHYHSHIGEATYEYMERVSSERERYA